MKRAKSKTLIITSLLMSFALTAGAFADSLDNSEKGKLSRNELLTSQQQEAWEFLQSLSSGTTSVDLWLNELLSEQKGQSNNEALADESQKKLSGAASAARGVG